MKPAPFRYAAPRTLDEALAVLSQHGAEAKVLAGGQSLVPLLNLRLARPELVVDINRVAGLDAVRHEDGWVEIGALVRQWDAERDPLVRSQVPLLAQALGYVAHPQIRARGTLCGSVAHADPAAEIPLVLTTLGGEVVAARAGGSRTLPAEAFFLDLFTTALASDELVTAIRLPAGGFQGTAFCEFSPREGDFALVAVAVALRWDAGGRIQEARVGVSGVGPTARRVVEAEAALAGEEKSRSAAQRAGEAVAAAVHASGDVHASAEYRRHLARVLTERAVVQAMAIGGEGVDAQ
ncbi:MAG: xanthine dehydrogenase family protein subunit M [Firmicutes bacterium]|nr:xanthine dehydrogenase family protein subunit M [Alicyclobacillaceae bacterium]MCL6496271.1 xanthine dehydrogenase family protein subunit M [Bacillota bacterium]